MDRQRRERYRIADLVLDVTAAAVTRQDGEVLRPPRLSFDLMVALARRAPAVVSPDELVATVWGGIAVSDETLTQRVALLRRSLGDDAKSPRYVRAVRGRGYQLVPAVVALPEAEAEAAALVGGKVEAAVQAEGKPGELPRAEGKPGAAAWAEGKPEAVAPAEGAPAEVVPAEGKLGAAALAEGKQTDVVSAEGKPAVAARGAWRTVPPRAALAAACLAGVAVLALVVAALVVPSHLAGAKNESTGAVREAPEPARAAALPPPGPGPATRSPSVPELLARAGAYLGRHQEANNELAIELYQDALRIEPANAQALAGLSLALGQRATKFNRGESAGEQALRLARRAVALDPRLGLAQHALGLALDSRGEVSAALAAYLRAAQLEPRPAAALASAANLLQVRGDLADALEADLRALREGGDTPPYLEVQVGGTLALLGFDPAATVWFERALALRPDNLFAAAAFARARLSQGRFPEADAIAARALERGIRRPELDEIRGAAALTAGDLAGARAFFEKALAIAPGFVRARTRLLVLARQSPGGAADARLERQARELAAELRRGRAEGDEWPDGALDEALLEAAAGRVDTALAALDAAIGLGFRDRGWLGIDPMLGPLRRDPRLAQRVERIRRLVEAERQRVLGAPWLPPALLAGSAARM
jgi:DNA-binding winged helix-turn-helix (wHTH) protein/tetratricopeptide (TPR) repeat protein